MALILLLICGLVLRVYTSCDFFLHFWDERYHALVAKHLMQHPFSPTLYENTILPYDYTQWTYNHIWVHKQPLPLWTMAASMKLFGVNEIALRLPSIMLTTIAIGLTFSIGRYFFSEKAGYIAALLYSINGFIIELASGRDATDHIDIFFLFFIELAIFFCIKYAQKQKGIYNVFVGVSIGAAILCKWLPALIVFPVWVMIFIDTRKFSLKTIAYQLLLILAIALAIAMPWQVYIFHAFPKEAYREAVYNSQHIFNVLEGHSGSFYYYFDEIRMHYGDLLYLPMLWFFVRIYKNKDDLKQWAICFWFLVPCLFFSFAKTKMPGYILFIAPALFIITAAFWEWLSKLNLLGSVKCFVSLLLFLLIALPARYGIERIKPFDRMDRNPAWVADLRKLNSKKMSNGILFNYEAPIEAMFYTNLTVYPSIPDETKIKSLLHEGYIVLIADNKNVPDNIRSINGIVFTKLIPPYTSPKMEITK